MSNLVEQKGNELIVFSPEEKKVIKDQFFPQGTSDIEMQYCMGVASQLGLNPILKQIYFVPRKSQDENGRWIDKVEPLAGRDAFLSLAHRSGRLAGIEANTSIKNTPIFQNGTWKEESDLVATATVYRTDTEKPFIVSVGFREYVQYKKNGDLTKFWKGKPETMLKKVAESQALRKAFNVSGLYDESEIGSEVVSTQAPKQTLQKKSVPLVDAAIVIEEEPRETHVVEETQEINLLDEIVTLYKEIAPENRAKIAPLFKNNKDWRGFDQDKLKLFYADILSALEK